MAISSQQACFWFKPFWCLDQLLLDPFIAERQWWYPEWNRSDRPQFHWFHRCVSMNLPVWPKISNFFELKSSDFRCNTGRIPDFHLEYSWWLLEIVQTCTTQTRDQPSLISHPQGCKIWIPTTLQLWLWGKSEKPALPMIENDCSLHPQKLRRCFQRVTPFKPGWGGSTWNLILSNIIALPPVPKSNIYGISCHRPSPSLTWQWNSKNQNIYMYLYVLFLNFVIDFPGSCQTAHLENLDLINKCLPSLRCHMVSSNQTMLLFPCQQTLGPILRKRHSRRSLHSNEEPGSVETCIESGLQGSARNPPLWNDLHMLTYLERSLNPFAYHIYLHGSDHTYT